MDALHKTQVMVRIALLGAISSLLTFVEIPLPFFPSFLKLDPSDIPAVVAALAYGPVSGIGVALIRLIVDLLKSSSGGVGQLANMIASSAYLIPLGIVYKRHKSLLGFYAGAGLASVCMILVACLFNYFVLIPAYAIIFGGMEAIINAASKVNSSVQGLGTLVMLAIAPFNALKAIMISVLGYLLYKPLAPLFRQASHT